MAELHVYASGSQTRFKWGTLLGFVQVAIAGVEPDGGVTAMVQPNAAETAFLFMVPLTILKLESFVWAYQTRPLQSPGSAMLRPNW